jgi:hypothetical protein
MPALDENTYYALQVRSVSDRLAPTATQRTTLIIAGIYVIVIAILWYVFPSLTLMRALNDRVVQACTDSQLDKCV